QNPLDEIESMIAIDVCIQRLQHEVDAFAGHYQDKARELTDLRRNSATTLASALEQQIHRLAMPAGRFQIDLKAKASAEPS
ncbi:DNA repair protein RecN, partial [Pseudomonas syringae pv. tagetis]